LREPWGMPGKAPWPLEPLGNRAATEYLRALPLGGAAIVTKAKAGITLACLTTLVVLSCAGDSDKRPVRGGEGGGGGEAGESGSSDEEAGGTAGLGAAGLGVAG
jgi:hypothetical protein